MMRRRPALRTSAEQQAALESRRAHRPVGPPSARPPSPWLRLRRTGRSRHVEPVAALAPPRLRVVLGGHRHARRHGHVHRVARAAVAALGRAPRRVGPRPLRQQPPPPPPKPLPAAARAHLRASSEKNDVNPSAPRGPVRRSIIGRAPASGGSNVAVVRGVASNRPIDRSIDRQRRVVKRPWDPAAWKGCRTGAVSWRGRACPCAR